MMTPGLQRLNPMTIHTKLPSLACKAERIGIADLEAAINFWRHREPSSEGLTLSPPVAALAETYAHMTLQRRVDVLASELTAPALAAWMIWYQSTPDTPCIAICSTSQGDAICKGCGRTELEVQAWPAMTPFQKRETWRRIEADATAWRFNRYAERVRHAPVYPSLLPKRKQ